MSVKKRVCVIGAGPSGMAFLYQMEKLRSQGADVPQVVCYEKQNDCGGLWNYSWRVGLDQHGEYVHNSMYRYLWSNGPKEASLEFPDYSYEEHFGKSIPSFPPREVLFDYINGRWNKMNVRRFVKLEHVVRDVQYDATTDTFTVRTKNLKDDVLIDPETFDYVINATGHFSVPNVPNFEGLDRFRGRVMHSHDFRDAVEFKGKKLLIVGASYSAEDIALQTMKYGAESVICSYRTLAMDFKWPKGIEERPLLAKLEGHTAFFKDGSKAEIDSIILATGYLHHYPYLDNDLRLKGANVLYPPDLYKGTVWMKGGNHKVMYIGVQDQYYTWTMFDAQARWAVKYVLGEIRLPKVEEMQKDIDKWVKRNKSLAGCHQEIDFQTDFTMDLANESDYGCSLDIGAIFHAWENDKKDNIATYRDQSFTSVFTKKKSPIHHSPFMEAMDDSLKCYLAVKQ